MVGHEHHPAQHGFDAGDDELVHTFEDRDVSRGGHHAVKVQDGIEEIGGVGGAGPHLRHRGPHRGDIVARSSFERGLGHAELEIEARLEEVERMRVGRLKPEVQRPGPHLRRGIGHGDTATGSGSHRHQVAVAQDPQRLVHHRRADPESIHQLRAASEMRAHRKALGHDLLLEISGHYLGPRRTRRRFTACHPWPPSTPEIGDDPIVTSRRRQ